MNGIQSRTSPIAGAGRATIDLLAGQVQVMFATDSHIGQHKASSSGARRNNKTRHRAAEVLSWPTPCRARAREFFGSAYAKNPPEVWARLNSGSTPGCVRSQDQGTVRRAGCQHAPGTPADFSS